MKTETQSSTLVGRNDGAPRWYRSEVVRALRCPCSIRDGVRRVTFDREEYPADYGVGDYAYVVVHDCGRITIVPEEEFLSRHQPIDC